MENKPEKLEISINLCILHNMVGGFNIRAQSSVTVEALTFRTW